MSNNNNVAMWICNDSDYEEIKNNIIVRVVPAACLPSDACVFENVGDLSIVPVYVPDFDDLDNVSFIPESVFSNWNIRRNIFFNYCIQNTENKYNLEIKSSPIGKTLDINDLNLSAESMPIIHNNSMFGASAIFYTDVCKKIAAAYNDSFYIVFISYDMCILHKFGTIDISSIKRHLKATNSNFKDGKTLTNQVYYYDKSKEHIFMVQSEEYTKYFNLINDINIGDCKCYYEYCSVYDVSEDIIDYIVDNIDDINYNNKHEFIEKLIELEKEV